MQPDDSGLHRPSAEFVHVACGNEPKIYLEGDRVRLYCEHCKVEVVYGERRIPTSSGRPES